MTDAQPAERDAHEMWVASRSVGCAAVFLYSADRIGRIGPLAGIASYTRAKEIDMFKFLHPSGTTEFDGEVFVYNLPQRGQRWARTDHPEPVAPDGSACGPGRLHLMKRLDARYAPTSWWPWWARPASGTVSVPIYSEDGDEIGTRPQANLVGEDNEKAAFVAVELRRIEPRVLWRALRPPFNWGFGADLRRAVLILADLRDADLRGADLRGADLRRAVLRRAVLILADLRGANLGGADLRDADLRGADLFRANLRGANLGGANLGGADLRDAVLILADLRGANLGGANLRDAQLETAIR